MNKLFDSLCGKKEHTQCKLPLQVSFYTGSKNELVFNPFVNMSNVDIKNNF